MVSYSSHAIENARASFAPLSRVGVTDSAVGHPGQRQSEHVRPLTFADVHAVDTDLRAVERPGTAVREEYLGRIRPVASGLNPHEGERMRRLSMSRCCRCTGDVHSPGKDL
jgi:hypothetical protein